MKSLRPLLCLTYADFLERSRRYNFLVTLGLTIFVAYLSIPPSSANYLMMGLDHYRGVYNSAWIGGAVAVISSTLLSLPAFYLVKNTIERDEHTRVGQIIATTPLTKSLYILGKTFSNFVFLVVMVGVIALGAGVMQLIRAEVLQLDLWSLFSPFIFCVLPAMAVISALAVLFETIPWLRGTLGNVVYMLLWMAMLLNLGSNALLKTPVVDLLGVKAIISSMMTSAAAIFPAYRGGFAISMSKLQQPLQTFTWNGVDWTVEVILGRMLWLGVALGVVLIAALFFRRFDPASRKLNLRRDQNSDEPFLPESIRPQLKPISVHLTPLTSTRRSFYPLRILLAELRLLFNGIRWWWIIIMISVNVAGILLPLEPALRYLLPVAWIIPLAFWSSMGIREKRYDTEQLIFSAPHPLRWQFAFVWLSGVVISVVMGLGVAVNIVLAGDWLHLLAWVAGALFIPSLALASGVWSGNNKLFEVVYVLWWYIGPIEQVDSLNFMGTSSNLVIHRIYLYGFLAILFLALAVVGRKNHK